MQKYRDVILDPMGNVVLNAQVTITDNGSNSLSSIFSDNGINSQANPFPASAVDGSFWFYAANGRYDITIAAPGFGPEHITDVTLDDPADTGFIPYATLADTANPSNGDALVGLKRTDTGTTGRTIHAYNEIREIYPELDFAAVGNDSFDCTSEFFAAYTAANLRNCPLKLGKGTFKITSQLPWNGRVDIWGRGENTIIKAYGNFDAIKISGGAQESEYKRFSIERGSGTGHGIWVNDAAHAVFDSVKTRGHSGYGWYLYNASTPTGFFTNYINCSAALSGIDGWYINNHWRSSFISSEADINTGWGFNFVLGDYHTGVNTQSQGNVAGGYKIATNQNNFDIYGEDNTGPDLYLTATSNHNNNTIVNITTYPDDIDDRGTDNTQIMMSGVIGVSSRRITRPKRTTNVDGLPVSILGGAAGPGATGTVGGPSSLVGGDSNGDTLAIGGPAVVQGGSPVHGGRIGDALIQAAGGFALVGLAGPNTAGAKLQAVDGLTFPAVAVPSSDPNTLDDYSESTVTVTLTTGTSGTITLNSGAGGNLLSRTKSGRTVMLNGVITVASVSSPVGVLFLNITDTAADRSAVKVDADGLAATATTSISGRMVVGESRIRISKFSAGARAALAGDVQAGAEFYIEATFTV